MFGTICIHSPPSPVSSLFTLSHTLQSSYISITKSIKLDYKYPVITIYLKRKDEMYTNKGNIPIVC